MLALTGFLICLFGVVVFTATVRVHAFKRSLKQGLLTFVPFYPWWYGFTQYDRPNKKTVLALTAASIILGCILLIIGMGLGSISKARADSIRMEGMENLRRLCIGAAEFYNNPRMDQTLKFLPQHFPAPAGPEPKEGTCCANLGGPDKDGDGFCDGHFTKWQSPSWSDLQFNPVSDKLACVYELKTEGEGRQAVFTVEARCDSDCDGKVMTIRRSVKVDSFNYAEPSPDMYIEEE